MFGLNSVIVVNCENCSQNFTVSLNDPSSRSYDLNNSLLSDPVTTKIGQEDLNKLLQSVELPELTPDVRNEIRDLEEPTKVYIKEEIDIEENFHKE